MKISKKELLEMIEEEMDVLNETEVSRDVRNIINARDNLIINLYNNIEELENHLKKIKPYVREIQYNYTKKIIAGEAQDLIQSMSQAVDSTIEEIDKPTTVRRS